MKNQNGYTLIEMSVVIIILCILMSVSAKTAVPAMRMRISRARCSEAITTLTAMSEMVYESFENESIPFYPWPRGKTNFQDMFDCKGIPNTRAESLERGRNFCYNGSIIHKSGVGYAIELKAVPVNSHTIGETVYGQDCIRVIIPFDSNQWSYVESSQKFKGMLNEFCTFYDASYYFTPLRYPLW